MKRIVVIGGVAVGLKAAAQARRGDQQASITVLERGKFISYAGGMPDYVGGDINEIEDLMKTSKGIVRNSGFFKSVKDINVLIQTEAIAIDRQSKIVIVKKLVSGEEERIPYDKLVIATGASAIKPPLPGVELGNIYLLKDPDDAKAIRQGLENGQFKSAVIIGAGMIGMEMSAALTKRQLQVTVVQRNEQILPAFLDPEIAEVVAQYIAEKGITILTEENVIRFTGETIVTAVETDKRTISVDLVILAIGVRPNVGLAEVAGLAIGATGAIMVDEEMRTSDPDIYAGGDCVENVNMLSKQKTFAPKGSTANKHGRIIGENLCDGHVKFKGVLNTVVVRIQGLTVGKTGLREYDAKQLGYDYITAKVTSHDKPHYMPGAKLITVKLIADSNTGKVLGMQAVGEGEVAKRVDVVAAVLTLGGTINDLFDIDLSYAPSYSSPIDNVAVAANLIMDKLADKLKDIS